MKGGKSVKKREKKCKKFDEKKENRHEERMRGGDEKEGRADCSATFCQTAFSRLTFRPTL